MLVFSFIPPGLSALIQFSLLDSFWAEDPLPTISKSPSLSISLAAAPVHIPCNLSSEPQQQLAPNWSSMVPWFSSL